MLPGPRCDYEASALSQTDARGTFPLEVGAENDLVSIVKESPFLTGREDDRLSAPTGQLEQTSLRAGVRSSPGRAR